MSYTGRARGSRPWRGRGYGNFRNQSSNDSAGSNRSSEPSSSSNSSSRPRPPPHLKGREIGLWYRDQGQKVNSRMQNETDAKIRKNFSCALTSDRQEHLNKLIQDLGEREYDTSHSTDSFQRKYRKNLEGNEQPREALEVHADDPDPSEHEFNSIVFSAQSCSKYDSTLLQKFEAKQGSKKYKEMQTFRKTLPAFGMQGDIVELIRKNQVVIISGETGCGKTTQVPQFILDSAILSTKGSLCNIICTQPRRISAISVAERVANERDEKIGESVGYSIRLEHRFAGNRSGKMTFMTTGVMFQCLQSNKNLDNLSHLIIDEVHERSIHSDFLLTIMKDLLQRRPDLKLILMSATMNAREFSEYYDNAPVFHIPGFTHPITEYYLEDVIEQTKFVFEDSRNSHFYRGNSSRGGDFSNNDNEAGNSQQRQYSSFPSRQNSSRKKYGPDAEIFESTVIPYMKSLRTNQKYSPSTIDQLMKPESEEVNLHLIQALLEHIAAIDRANGAILVFVTGWDMISKLAESLESSGKFPGSRAKIFPLHSMMPTVNQKEIFMRPPAGVRKIVIATQIAETSITIDDILWVVDCGKIKLGNFDESNNLATLDVEWVSQANAHQRRGRAGRVQAGNVYHLFSRPRSEILEKFKKPEILRTRLEETILQIKILKLGKVHQFLSRLLNPPSELAINLGLQTLRDLHALDDEEQLTPLGFHLAHLPMDPQTGKMILLASLFSCVDPIFSIAASLSFKDPFFRPLGKERLVDEIRKNYSGQTKSDHLILAKVIKEYEKAVENHWERKFCYQNFLSESTVKMLINMKGQLAGYLHKLGFLPDNDYKNRELNRNSNNLSIVMAVMAAGLYPNVVQVKYMGRNGRVVFRCSNSGNVKLHPGSVNCEERQFESPYLVYFKKVKSSKIFLHDTTMVNPFALIFFGGRLTWNEPERFGSANLEIIKNVAVDNKFHFSYPSQQNFRFYVESLRTELDKFLQHKVNNPGPMDWSKGSKESCLLNAIVELLTCEYEAFQILPGGDEDEEDDSEDERARQRRMMPPPYKAKRQWQRR